jgi:hypothetical protein
MSITEPVSACAEHVHGSGAAGEVTRTRRLNRADAMAIGALLTLVGVVAWLQLWHRPGLGDWDIMTFYLPWYGFLGDHVRHFDIPGWNPYIFSGTPFAGDPQSGWMYVPAMVLFALLPAVSAYKVFIAFHFALGGFAAFVYARLLRIGTLGALAGGVVFGLGQNVGASDCCTIHLQLANWLPIALIGIELAQLTNHWRNRLAALALAAVAVSQMLAGWIGQGSYYAAIVVGTYVVFRTVIAPPGKRFGWRRRIASCAIDGGIIAGLGIGLAAAGLLPRLDVTRRSYVGSAEYQGADFAPDRGWGWWTVLRVTVGYRPEWHPYYVGGAALSCALLALLAFRRYAVVGYFAALVAVVVILPLRPTPLHDLFYLLPRFRGLHLHDPGRVFAILPVGMSVLVAIAVDSLPGFLSRRWGLLLALVPVALWVYLVDTASRGRQPIAGITTAATFAVAGLLALAAGLNRLRALVPRSVRARMGPITAISLISVLLADPTGFGVAWPAIGPRDESSVRAAAADISDSVIWSAIAQNGSKDDPGGAGEFLQERQREDGEPFRYFGYVAPSGPNWQEHEHYMEPEVLPLLTNGRSIRLGLQEVQGYDPAHLDRYRLFFQALNGAGRDYHEELVYPSGVTSPLLNLLNVRYIIIPNQIPSDGSRSDLDALVAKYPEVFGDDRIRVLGNGDALPRAWIVHDARTVTPDESLNLLASGEVDPRQTVLLETTAPALSRADPARDESVAVSAYEDERVELTVEAATDGVVVLADAYDPGWSVYVDGKRTRLYSADFVLRGVFVTAGHHVIEFRYEPRSLRIGMVVSIVSLILVAVIGVRCLSGRLTGAIKDIG